MLFDSYLLSSITGLIHLLSAAPDRADSRGFCFVSAKGGEKKGKERKEGGLLAVAEATLEHPEAQCLLCLREKIAPDRNQLSVNCQASLVMGGPTCGLLCR